MYLKNGKEGEREVKPALLFYFSLTPADEEGEKKKAEKNLCMFFSLTNKRLYFITAVSVEWPSQKEL